MHALQSDVLDKCTVGNAKKKVSPISAGRFKARTFFPHPQLATFFYSDPFAVSYGTLLSFKMADMELSTTSKVEASGVKEVVSEDIEYNGSNRCRLPDGLESPQTLDVGFIEVT